MDVEDQFSLEQLIFKERRCRTCGNIKSLMDDFYLTRKDRCTASSAYSYECKSCTIKRILESRKNKRLMIEWNYPDW